MTARLWFVHRGIERIFQGVDAEERWISPTGSPATRRSATRWPTAWPSRRPRGSSVSDDALVAPRSCSWRSSGIYNHVGDIGALCNDVSLGVAYARALDDPRAAAPDERRGDGSPSPARRHPVPVTTSVRRLSAACRSSPRSPSMFDALVTSPLQQRRRGPLRGDGRSRASRCTRAIGTLGVVARASGLASDARDAHPFLAAPQPFARQSRRRGGDVLARFDPARRRAARVVRLLSSDLIVTCLEPRRRGHT